MTMDRREMLHWLHCEDVHELQTLWDLADQTRREQVGEAVHLRGLVEISNHCARGCHYCGLRAANRKVDRYRMATAEILHCAHQAVALGYGTLVLQSGEDDRIEAGWLADLISQIKAATPLALTLSVGERTEPELQAWKDAGADRYLLRFETSDAGLYRTIHPDRDGKNSDRIALLRQLRRMGYEIGSGVMVGIPGQRYTALADDLLLFTELDLDMIGIGPFIAHPDTPLGQAARPVVPLGDQVPATIDMTCKMLALARIARPDANIPATTAVAVMNVWQGRELALKRGANVIMPNLTPRQYRELYAIYPGKASKVEAADHSDSEIRRLITTIDRSVAKGPGGRRRNLGGCGTGPRKALPIAVCMGSSCYSRGNNGRTIETLRHCVEAEGFVAEITGHLCEDQCTCGPHITIAGTLYSNIQPSCIPELLKHHLATGKEANDG